MTDKKMQIDGASARIYPDAPSWDGRKTAAIGAFSCNSEKDGAFLLNQICSSLSDRGFEAVIGPMDGDTWHSYRTITETDGSRPFLMEPTSGSDDHAALLAAGFTGISSYASTWAPLAKAIQSVPAPIDTVTITAWDGSDPVRLFANVYDLSLGTFQRNAFYKPITRQDFLARYESVVPLLDRRFILFARNADAALVGFLFGIANHLEGPAPKSVILKSYASALPGVGHNLAHAFHLAALEGGFETVIHALMHENNISLDRSARHGAGIFRRYALMGRVLQP